jgi:hypothetical protein
MAHEPNTHSDDVCEEEACLVCGDVSTPVFSPVEARKLMLATTICINSTDDKTIIRVLDAATWVRLRTRALKLALEGRLVPVQIHESGDVFWRPIEQRLTPAEMTEYRLEFEQVADETFDSAYDDLLTGAERERLWLAARAGLEEGPQPYELLAAVSHWAETVRMADRNLQAILAGRLVPVAPADDKGRICLKEVGDLPADERARYQREFTDLEAQCT